jgi:CDP-diacylglycerol--serine O-phosphatidyltransferase
MARLARVVWLILPVLLAGLGHVAVLKLELLRWLAQPLDRGWTWRGRPLLGPNKTWRGLLVMASLTGVLTGLQAAVERAAHLRRSGVSRRYRPAPWRAGIIIGLAYCLGEIPNSLVKRRLGIPAGRRASRHASVQYVVDQTDSVVGCLAALRLLYRPRRGELALAFVLGSLAHIAIDLLLYRLGIKRHDGRG